MATVITLKYGQRAASAVVTTGVGTPSPTIGADDIAIWVGANLPRRRNNEILNAIDECVKKIHEAQAPMLGTHTSAVKASLEASKESIVVAAVATAVPSDDGVAVIYGVSFPYAGGSSQFVDGMVEELKTVWKAAQADQVDA